MRKLCNKSEWAGIVLNLCKNIGWILEEFQENSGTLKTKINWNIIIYWNFNRWVFGSTKKILTSPV